MARPERGRLNTHVGVPLLIGILLTTGCGGSDNTGTKAATRPAPSSSTDTATGAAVAGATATSLPTQTSDFPDGVYRTQITVSLLQSRGVEDLSNAGIWTLTVRTASYRLECRTLADPGVDCGNSPAGGIVEAGNLRGRAPKVWFVHDMKRLSELTGCVPGSAASNGCGPEGGYHLDWSFAPHGVKFAHYVGLGDEAGHVLDNWTARPWTRIS